MPSEAQLPSHGIYRFVFDSNMNGASASPYATSRLFDWGADRSGNLCSLVVLQRKHIFIPLTTQQTHVSLRLFLPYHTQGRLIFVIARYSRILQSRAWHILGDF